MKGKNKYLVEIYKKYSIPFACILFILIGAPIGILAKKGGFSISILLSFGFFLFYYLMLIGGEELADRNKIPALICMWSPNVIFLLFALYFNIIAIKEKTPKLIFFIKKSNDSIRYNFKKRDGITLSKNEIKWFILSFLDDKISDAQMASLLMAIYFKWFK